MILLTLLMGGSILLCWLRKNVVIQSHSLILSIFLLIRMLFIGLMGPKMDRLFFSSGTLTPQGMPLSFRPGIMIVAAVFRVFMPVELMIHLGLSRLLRAKTNL